MKTIGTERLSSLASRFKLIESLDDRMIGLMRLVLASSALLIIYLDPAEPDHLVRETYSALVLYVLYSLVLYIDTLSRKPVLSWRRNWAHWIDLLWYTVLIGLSSGTTSPFFFFFYFSILVASFRFGLRSGVRITIVSTVLFTVVGYLNAPSAFELNRFLLRPISLLVLGYMIAYWGGFEVQLKGRLKFLKDITRLSNPRFGVYRTIAWGMEQLISFYDADTCLLITSTDESNSYHLRRVKREIGEPSSSVETVERSIAMALLLNSSTEALIHRRGSSRCLTYDVETGSTTEVKLPNALEAAIGSEAFLSVPVSYRRETIGRFYIVGGERRFAPSDAEFVLQAIDQVIPVLDNIRLVDNLASDAAERERERIARDIHDSIIQPYIGLQLGLAAISHRIDHGDQDVRTEIRELGALAVKGISELRRYVGEIKTGERRNETQLLAALRRFCSRFSQATGIEVEVLASEDLSINDRLAGEVFQMITEGLSNIRRHTKSRFARTELSRLDGNLVIRIENESRDGDLKEMFHPQSISDRVASLGGQLSVDMNAQKTTAVVIEIPL